MLSDFYNAYRQEGLIGVGKTLPGAVGMGADVHQQGPLRQALIYQQVEVSVL
jgi:hypothetical protein